MAILVKALYKKYCEFLAILFLMYDLFNQRKIHLSQFSHNLLE